jgi:hypothetical protein
VVGSFATDGNGNIVSGVADYNTASGVSSTGPVNLTASTYTILADGRGQATIAFNSQTFNVDLVLYDFVSGVAQKGKMISSDGSDAYGEFELQTAAENLNTSANYVFGFNGLDASNQSEAEIGLFNTGTNTGSYDVDDGGTIDEGASSPGPTSPLSLSPVTIGAVSSPGNRGTATLGSVAYAYYTVSSSKAYFIETDTNGALAGTAELQTATVNDTTNHYIDPLTPENNSNDCYGANSNGIALEPYCNYAFLLLHAANAQNGTFERAGQIDYCPCAQGGINNDREDETDGATWTIGTGTYGFSPIGRGLLRYPVVNGSSNENRYAIVYVVSNSPGTDTTSASSRFYMMSTDSGDTSPGVGIADFINAVPTDVPTVGSYAFSAANIGNTKLLELGLAVFSGSNVTGIAYVNDSGTLSTEVINGTFSPSSNSNVISGDGRGSISSFNSTTTSMGVYSVGSQGLVLVGTGQGISGRMEPQ